MGLEKFNVAEDNKGGRKSSDDDRDGSVFKQALTEERDTEEFWRNLLQKHSGGERPEGQEMAAICGEAYVNPRTVRQKLHEHGIFKYDIVKKRRMERKGLEPDPDSSMINAISKRI